MKCYCVVNFKSALQLIEQPTPTPKGKEVLVEVRAAGVCHSDLHFWEGGYDLGNGRTLSLKDRGIKLPMTMGHETAGTAVAMGPEAKGVTLGKNYLVYPWIGCGKCPACVEEIWIITAQHRNTSVFIETVAMLTISSCPMPNTSSTLAISILP